ncbi:universal stress protein [Haloferax mediterranei ATCC 33500]|nr:universal stress protein [Haloferax mediterranei ATCC 33500]
MVPFDGSSLARAALVRATEYAEALDESVVVVSVIPDDEVYLRQQGWTQSEETFDIESVVESLREEVTELSPDATFRYERTTSSSPQSIAREIRAAAADIRPTVVFLGSENVGEIVTPVSSVGGEVAANVEYDVYIVRHWSQTTVSGLEPQLEQYPTTEES